VIQPINEVIIVILKHL